MHTGRRWLRSRQKSISLIPSGRCSSLTLPLSSWFALALAIYAMPANVSPARDHDRLPRKPRVAPSSAKTQVGYALHRGEIMLFIVIGPSGPSGDVMLAGR